MSASGPYRPTSWPLSEMKYCPGCRTTKPFGDFYRNKNNFDGFYVKCKDCVKAYRQERFEADPEGHRAYQRQWMAQDENRLRNLEGHFRRKYGLSLADRQKMVEEQEGRCFICGIETDLHVDHNAETGQIRRMLCGPCNRGIGMFHHDPQALKAAASYLELFEDLENLSELSNNRTVRPIDSPG